MPSLSNKSTVESVLSTLLQNPGGLSESLAERRKLVLEVLLKADEGFLARRLSALQAGVVRMQIASFLLKQMRFGEVLLGIRSIALERELRDYLDGRSTSSYPKVAEMAGQVSANERLARGKSEAA